MGVRPGRWLSGDAVGGFGVRRGRLGARIEAVHVRIVGGDLPGDTVEVTPHAGNGVGAVGLEAWTGGTAVGVREFVQLRARR